MREIRQSGSEGGAAQSNALSLPLSQLGALTDSGINVKFRGLSVNFDGKYMNRQEQADPGRGNPSRIETVLTKPSSGKQGLTTYSISVIQKYYKKFTF